MKTKKLLNEDQKVILLISQSTVLRAFKVLFHIGKTTFYNFLLKRGTLRLGKIVPRSGGIFGRIFVPKISSIKSPPGTIGQSWRTAKGATFRLLLSKAPTVALPVRLKCFAFLVRRTGVAPLGLIGCDVMFCWLIVVL